MSSAAGHVAHVRGTAVTGQSAVCNGGRVAGVVHLQGAAEEQVHTVQTGDLRQRAVGAERAVLAGKEDIRSGRSVLLHADFTAERTDLLDPAVFNRRDQRRMRIQHPVCADLALQAKFIAVGRQQQLNGTAVVADAVVQGHDAVLGIDALDDHHAHQDMRILNLGRIPGKQRYHRVRLICLDDIVDPVTRDIHPRQIFSFNNLIDLHNDDAVLEGGRLGNGRGFFSIVAGEQVAVPVCLVCRQQDYIRGQVNIQTAIQFQIGMDGTDPQFAF